MEPMERFGVSVVRRVCSFCGGHEGLRLWRWSGRVFLTTHTLCSRCAEREFSREATLTGEAPAA
jgi:hypothetical protein